MVNCWKSLLLSGVIPMLVFAVAVFANDVQGVYDWETLSPHYTSYQQPNQDCLQDYVQTHLVCYYDERGRKRCFEENRSSSSHRRRRK